MVEGSRATSIKTLLRYSVCGICPQGNVNVHTCARIPFGSYRSISESEHCFSSLGAETRNKPESCDGNAIYCLSKCETVRETSQIPANNAFEARIARFQGILEHSERRVFVHPLCVNRETFPADIQELGKDTLHLRCVFLILRTAS